MTTQRAHELLPSVRTAFERIFAARTFGAVYLAVGRDYLFALQGIEGKIPPATTLTIASGSQGKRLAGLHDWLYGAPPALRAGASGSPSQLPLAKGIRMRGVTVSMTADEVRARARQALEHDAEHRAGRYQAWYVALDGQRVAPKWLVSHITGLAPGAFTTDDARRLLARLGFAVHRV
jgi:hypothetical protein